MSQESHAFCRSQRQGGAPPIATVTNACQNQRMEFFILLFVALVAFVGWAPEQLTQAALLLAWLLGASFVVWPLLQLLGSFL